jgi:hypothetical protein
MANGWLAMSVNTKFVYLRLKPHKSLLVKGSHRLAEIITLRNETSSASVVQLL